MRIIVPVVLCGILAGVSGVRAAETLMSARTSRELADAFERSEGWKLQADALVGESPEYYALPETARGDFPDDAWTYFTVHPVDLWRYATAGDAAWSDYTFQCTVRVEKPAPLTGPRPGATFFNYQWGREAIGSDAGILVRYRGPDECYMVRLSSGYDHVELWKARGGIVQVRPLSLEPGKSCRVSVTAAGRWIVVSVDGKEAIRYCDPIDPILTGKVGVAVRESRVQFSDVQVERAAAINDALPRHVADFRVRKWVGRDYIFDGDEPVGWFGWMGERGMDVREVKLAPGLMPLVMPHAGVELYDYTPGGDLKITGEGKSLSFTVRMGRKDTYEVHSRWEISYDPDVGYIWDKKARLVNLGEKPLPVPPVEDLYYYQVVAPATDKLPKCRQEPNWCIVECEGGRIVTFLNAHWRWHNGLADPTRDVVRPDGCLVSTVDGWGVGCQLPADDTHRYYSEQCHWGLDKHVKALAPPLAKGEVYEGHARIFLWSRERVADALKRGVRPVPAMADDPELIRHAEPVNKCDRILPGLTGETATLWTGKYHVDRTTGRGDRVCMRIDTADLTDPKAERPSVFMGASNWTGPYLAPKYRFGIYVKADQFNGKVILSASGFVQPKPQPIPEARAELNVDGRTDWTPVSFTAAFPREVFNWVVTIDVVGKGTVWVDDIEVTPLKD